MASCTTSTHSYAEHPELRKRAIQQRLVTGRWGERYVPFDMGDWQTFKAGHSEAEPWHKSSIVSKTGGLIVNRWDARGHRLQSYVRPNNAVWIYGRNKPSKYIYPSRTRFPGAAAQLDVHPLVRDRLAGSGDEPIYLCIEGCLKADAVAGTGRPAISVPSVTMWRLDDEVMAQWLPALRRAPFIYLIPDSDYNPKRVGYEPGTRPVFVKGGEVRFFTDRCAIFLRRRHGLRVRYLVPPYLSRHEASMRGVDSEGRWKVGIDDHIAWGKNWQRWNQSTNPDGLHEFEYQRGAYRRLPKADWPREPHGRRTGHCLPESSGGVSRPHRALLREVRR